MKAGSESSLAEAGPKRTTSLRSRRAPLASAGAQLARLDALTLPGGDFDAAVAAAGFPAGLRPGRLEIFQINVGRLCNMTCRHCHVDAGPDRVVENMNLQTIDACLRALDATDAHTVDLTGGAPELNPHFRYLVDQCIARGKHVMDRCNLTVLLLPQYADLPDWFAERGVEVVCSLPHYRKLSTDAQRGDGAFERSIEALGRLNAAGYGHGDERRRLTLMHNPAGAFLPGSQASMEREWKAALLKNHGVRFDRLIALNNMPIARYLEWLEETDNLQPYMEKLVGGFNPAAVGGLMCRNTLSIAWDGTLHDCDFNQMLEIPADVARGNVRDLDLEPLMGRLAARRVATARHCFGCTAGAGSSCGGATS
ncbi:MAG: arsenosugar biosynthesis radical SAM protein ArsS [Pseudomonadota bacterium]|nr:arsenosugar biosynthesis radical SAM protein ArsS [Pseudomonadota bacterium]